MSLVEENTEENIFDIESATNKKLDYFIFENTKVEESAVAQMYFYVIKELFKKNTQLLINNQEVIKSSKSKSDFRSPQEIINGYFVEFNIDSNSKFRNLKKLLSLFEMEEELIVKFSMENEIESETRFGIRREFWKQLLPMLSNTSLFSNVNPTKNHWLSSGAGFSGIYYTMLITASYVAIELSIVRASKQENKRIFNQLFQNKKGIESSFGSELNWEELKDKKMSKIIAQLNEVNLFEKEDWDKMSNFLINNLPLFELAFQSFINELKSDR